MSGTSVQTLNLEYAETLFDQRRKEGIFFAIYELASLRPIGTTQWWHIDRTHRIAEYGISIGEKDCWGKGYGTETTILMLDYAFTVLGLHSVHLCTFAYNERAIRAYTRAGFRVMGRQREAARVGDQVYDVVFMDCLATEFRSPLRRVVDLP